MTALVAVSTPKGFVIGADGRRQEACSRTVISDSIQKVLPAFCGNIYAACGIAGAGGFVNPHGAEFSTFAEVERITGDLAKQDFASVLAYAWKIAECLYERIFEQTGGTIPSEQMPNSTFVSLLIVGYSGLIPALGQIIIPHQGRRVLAPEWTRYRVENHSELVISSGSELVLDDLKREGLLYQPESLSDGLDLVHFYISECIRHNKDYEDCAGIGGHIHIATATPEGFAWQIEPLKGAQ